jgi:hypothetical protein
MGDKPPAEDLAIVTAPEAGERALVQAQPSCSFLAVPLAPLPEKYDPEREEKEYARSLLKPRQLARVKSQTGRKGFLTVEQVQALVNQTVKHDFELHESVRMIDAELILRIDTFVDRPVFILPQNRVVSREKLFETYPFEQLNAFPEELFAQQEVGAFPNPSFRARRSLLDEEEDEFDDEFLYIARDLGSTEPWTFTVRGSGAAKPERIVKTKVYLAKDGWEEFLLLCKQVRGMMRIRAIRERAIGYTTAAGTPAEFAAGVRALESADGREERLRKLEAEVEAKTQKLERLLAEFGDAI